MVAIATAGRKTAFAIGTAPRASIPTPGPTAPFERPDSDRQWNLFVMIDGIALPIIAGFENSPGATQVRWSESGG
jgi:hypothetical protein